jgi:hypothetical protein
LLAEREIFERDIEQCLLKLLIYYVSRKNKTKDFVSGRVLKVSRIKKAWIALLKKEKFYSRNSDCCC